MTKDELKRNLFDDRTRLFCVLDGAAVPKLPVRLHEARPANHCLFPGELEPDMVYAAPYLVHLAPDNEFTDWVHLFYVLGFLNLLGKEVWIIFSFAALSELIAQAFPRAGEDIRREREILYFSLLRPASFAEIFADLHAAGAGGFLRKGDELFRRK